MHGVDTGGKGGGGWGLKNPQISGSTLYLLERIVHLYQNLMLAVISLKPKPNPNLHHIKKFCTTSDHAY